MNGTTTQAPVPPEDDSAGRLAGLFHHLRVTDVCDAMDGIGYFDIGLMDTAIRPLWPGMKFWGEAVTIRAVPANKPMWKLESTEDILDAHALWFAEPDSPHVPLPQDLRPGHVVVMDSGGGPEVGFFGSVSAMVRVHAGAVGIVTDGYCRDTGELTLQKTPICSRHPGRTIIPGRIQVVETQTTIACGGVQVRPGDIVGCDDDGIVVVPKEVAADVAVHAHAILLADMRMRSYLYERLDMAPDATVDFESVERYILATSGPLAERFAESAAIGRSGASAAIAGGLMGVLAPD